MAVNLETGIKPATVSLQRFNMTKTEPMYVTDPNQVPKILKKMGYDDAVIKGNFKMPLEGTELMRKNAPREVGWQPRGFYTVLTDKKPLPQLVRLSELHYIDPKHTVKPLGAIKEAATGKTIGYAMELVRGRQFGYYGTKIDTIEMLGEQLMSASRTVSGWHANNTGHGDPNPTNLIVQDRSAVMFIDPAPRKPERSIILDSDILTKLKAVVRKVLEHNPLLSLQTENPTYQWLRT